MIASAIVLLCLLSIVTADVRCGNSWGHANDNCGNRACSNNNDCPGQSCWADVKSCSSPRPPVVVNPPPPPPPSNNGGRTTTRCGNSWGHANDNCGRDCTTDSDCPGQSCWAALKSCGGSPPVNNPPVNIPPSNGGCGYRVTNAQLAAIMGRPGQDLNRFVGPLNDALVRYAMDCPNRITSFLSQVRHETAHLTIFHQPRDNGAGSLHMIPQNWGAVCRAVPEIRNMFAQKFGGCGNCECTDEMAQNPFGPSATRAALEIFTDPVAIWFSGAWWFAEGARTPSIFGWKGCGDLRVDSDQGLGGAGGSDCRHSGYYQVTCCVFWTIGGEAGMQQRIQYYNLAKSVIGGSNAIAGGDKTYSETTPADQMLTPAQIAGIVLGCVALVVIAVVLAVVLTGKKPTEEKV